MSMIQKIEFDALIAKANPLTAVQVCSDAVARVYADSTTIGGRKWAFSQLRKGWNQGVELIPPRGLQTTREDYAREVGAAVMRLVKKTDPATLKSMIVLSLMRLDANDAREYQRESNRAVVRDLDAEQSRRAIVGVDEFVTIGEQLLDGRSYLDRILGICALTGRRTIEVATSAHFEPINGNRVFFTGQAKTRGRTDRVDGYPIPTLTDSARIVATLKTIREDRPDLVTNPELFHNRCAKDLHKRARVFAPCFNDKTAKPKDLRSAWAEICWLIHDERKSSKVLYMSRVLGHGEQDMVTALAYDDFTITDPEYS